VAKEKGFHTPFADVAKDLKKRMAAEAEAKREAAREAERAEARAAEAARKAAKKSKNPGPGPGAGEDVDFAAYMAGIERISADPRGRPGRAAPPAAAPKAAALREDDVDALAELAGMIDADDARLELDPDEEVLEGGIPGLDRRILRGLRRGDYPISAHLDLHGLRRDVARDAVERFVVESRRRKERAVVVVHGRGLNSEGGQPVLKFALRDWLARGPLARHVLAFAPARPEDGGAGAVYLLLRR
jgi:DNA-nicking Smr family endonuclease